MEHKMLITVIFLLAYLGAIFYTRKKMIIMTTSAGILLLIRLFAVPEGMSFFSHSIDAINWGIRSVNWNVMGIFWGMLYITGIFIYSKVPVLLADKLIEHSRNAGMAILGVCALSSVISAFVENVATVLIVAPIALAICQQLKISPVPALIGIAICSNLQGTATLIGDPPSMILAGAKHMSFNDFFVYQGKPGIFWAVEVGAIASFVVLAYLFRHYKQPLKNFQKEQILSFVPAVILIGLIICLAVSPMFDKESTFLGGILCAIAGAGSLIWYYLFTHRDWEGTKSFWNSYSDWETFFFLMAIFIVVESVKDAGLIDDVAQWLTSVVGNNVFLTYTIIVWGSVALSAIIDNVPYITAMIPLCQALAQNMGVSDNLLTFGLLVGACLGGNITPIGASANVVAVGILKRTGYEVRFSEFMKIGFPFTIAATFAGYLFFWVVWS